MALGRKNPLIDDFLVEGTANYIPPRPLRDIGVGLTLAWGYVARQGPSSKRFSDSHR